MQTFPRIMRIDLTSEKVTREQSSSALLRDFIGGRGLGTWVYINEAGYGQEPLASSNPMVFATGPLTGTTYPTAARSVLVTRSPLTRTISSSNMGGRFGTILRKAGTDVLIVAGKTEELSILVFDGENIEIKSARDLKGLDTHQTDKTLKQTYPKAAILSIGPAGEKLIPYASITHDLEHDFGRGGLGAVMGSKNLKAIVIEGKQKIPLYNAEIQRKHVKKMIKQLKKSELYRLYNSYGTKFYTSIYNSLGGMSVNQYERNRDERIEQLAEVEIKKFEIAHKSCSKCPVACRHTYELKGEKIYTPEFETIGTLGPNLGFYNPEIVLPLGEKLTKMGVDTISAGHTIATFVNLVKAGKIEQPDNKRWNFESEDILELFDNIIETDNEIGQLLAKGSAKMAQHRGLPELAPHVKGMEFAVYEPRKFMGQALGYGISPRGACHLHGGAAIAVEALGTPLRVDKLTWRGKGKLVANSLKIVTLIDSLVTCVHAFYLYVDLNMMAKTTPSAISSKFTSWVPSIALKFLNYSTMATALQNVTGEKFSTGMLDKAAQRTITLERIYNINAGFSKDDDYLPRPFYEKKTPESEPIDKKQYTRELQNYYEAMGWDKEGVPRPETIKKLGLEKIVSVAKY